MRTPTELELQHLAAGFVSNYDPAKRREYYLRTRKLKGRRRGTSEDPRTGKSMGQISKDARAKQRQELAARIQSLSKKLQKLEAKIREMEAAEASEDRKGKAKAERAAKEAAKPKTAAEKAEAAREAEKYRDKNQQKLKSEAKDAKSGGGSAREKKSGSKASSVSDLKALATKVKGQIAVAKQKLAAL